MKKKKQGEVEKPYGLCFRCERRARYLETLNQGKPEATRDQCGRNDRTVHSCYMFMPVKPLVTEPLDRRDRRPRLSMASISSREEAAAIADCKLHGQRVGKDGVVLYWKPRRK